jgi:hypothetical protein
MPSTTRSGSMAGRQFEKYGSRQKLAIWLQRMLDAMMERKTDEGICGAGGASSAA